ncbi:sensor histidine kinase [Mucilaginibacter jinjuensis]|uniref:Histidine kinase n=1 Tax=Mucilaginibacter jinjuensis TaxID=1176721 RepID=A0ABY7TE47_9SPHI|nr:histidine kinase [Mucilaginibacter jinjuensis]WCT14795.1 histidine kinase [Mucilaginibacter jinjuensis]
MKQQKLWMYYLLAWVGYVAYIYIDNVVNGRGSQPYVWSHLVASFVQFTFCFFVLYPKFLNRKLILVFIAGLIVAEGLFISTRWLVEEVLYVWVIGHGNYNPGTSILYYVGDNWWKAFQPILLSFIIWAFLETFNRERENEQLRQEKTQAELAFLKSQINPHFLYNTLNYMYSMAYPVSDRLADTIIKLSNLMRYMLADNANNQVDLEKEVDYLSNYIDIYRMRFEDHFFVDFKVSGNTGGVQIASLMLIPFVENAFKHGVMDDEQRPVRIKLQASQHMITFSVSNKINRNQKDHSSGIGMANIRRRLDLIYPGRYDLLIANNGDTYKSTLSIKLTQ